jgi:transglutaminase-like putative cysteine protease
MNDYVPGTYLSPSHIIDWNNPAVLKQALALSNGLTDDAEIARRCFQFVRDEILHSGDHKMNPVTLKASEVLEHRTGFCYAKSHLLAALLRANGVPTGLCYQRIAYGEAGSKFCLHGLNAIHLTNFGWYRVDARGDSEKVHARFTPPKESLAFELKLKEEVDLPGIREEPLPSVVSVLSNHNHYLGVLGNLPDIDIPLANADISTTSQGGTKW